jgi:hypothetical protein
VDEGREQLGLLPSPGEPVVEGGARQLDTVAGELVAEALGGIGVEDAANDELGEQARGRQAVVDELGGRRGRVGLAAGLGAGVLPDALGHQRHAGRRVAEELVLPVPARLLDFAAARAAPLGLGQLAVDALASDRSEVTFAFGTSWRLGLAGDGRQIGCSGTEPGGLAGAEQVGDEVHRQLTGLDVLGFGAKGSTGEELEIAEPVVEGGDELEGAVDDGVVLGRQALFERRQSDEQFVLGGARAHEPGLYKIY